jgi:hypothetical protein
MSPSVYPATFAAMPDGQQQVEPRAGKQQLVQVQQHVSYQQRVRDLTLWFLGCRSSVCPYLSLFHVHIFSLLVNNLFL